MPTPTIYILAGCNDVREAIRRVRQRVIEGGHDVPADDVRRRFVRSIQHLLNDYAPLAIDGFSGITQSAGKAVGGIRYSQYYSTAGVLFLP